MKKLNTNLLALFAAAALTACGGGGGGGATDDGASAPAPAPAPEAITVTATTPTTLTAADCPRLASDGDSAAALDLSNASISAVNDFLLAADQVHAHKVFIRAPGDFVNWIVNAGGTVDLLSVGVATHETLHKVDTALRSCAPVLAAKYQFMGSQLITDLEPGTTSNYAIVAETIDPALTSAPRYSTYIATASSSNGNDFSVLLDELAAYTGGAYTEVQLLQQGKVGGTTGSLDVNLGGMVNFMVYLENYLKSARLNHTAQYDAIKNSASTVAAIQAIWSRAEQILQDGYSFTASGDPKLIVDGAYFKAAYSASLLAELDAIGVTTHRSAGDWAGTYLP